MINKDSLAKLALLTPAQPLEPLMQNRPTPEQAAVLMLFAEGKDGLNILLTRRATHLRLHAGQVSFPGGKYESGDRTPTVTALRETAEETGLNPEMITPIGYFPPILTRSNYLIDLVVGFATLSVTELSTYLHPAPDEVAALWFEPLMPLMDASRYQKMRISDQNGVRQFWQIACS